MAKNHPALASMRRVAAQPGYLVRFRTDLETHDVAALRNQPIESPFGWIIGDSSTHFMPAFERGEAKASRTGRRFYPSTKAARGVIDAARSGSTEVEALCFWFDGSALVRVDADELARLASGDDDSETLADLVRCAARRPLIPSEAK